MTTTCNTYINEYSIFDDVFDCINEAVKDVNIAMGKYQIKLHQIESKMLFEGTDEESSKAKSAEESKGALAKIGNAVIKLITKVGDFIRKLGEKLTGNIKRDRSDEEKINKILSEHPDLKNEIVDGINKEWFTVADVAAFEKDTIGLINMLNKNAIDHQTFMDRFKEKCTKFAESSKPLVDAGTTVVKLMGIIPGIHKAAKESKAAVSAFQGALNEFKDNIDKNYSEKDMNKANAIFNAFTQAIGLASKDAQKNVSAHGKAWSLIHSICNSKIGKVFKADDASRKQRHDGAYINRRNKIRDEAQAHHDEQERINSMRGNIKNFNPNITDADLDATNKLGKKSKK